ncbi:MAG: glycosyltransferase family 2 protein [Pseudolabrys sp.]
MIGPLVTIGVPVYRGQDMLPVTLECLRTQTYDNLDVVISVDGLDDPSIEACRPFLSDPRFRLHVQPSRLGWAGNHDWTMRARRGEFYIYQQHDDQVSPDYVAALVAAARQWPQASVCFSKVKITGLQNRINRTGSCLGDPVKRALRHMERLDTIMLRGLMRGSALAATSGLIMNEFEGYGSDYRFLAELALVGEFRFVEGPTYYKRVHGGNLHLKWYDWPDERKRGAWVLLAASMIEVIVPAGGSVEERWRLLHAVLERFLFSPGWLSRSRNRARSLYKTDRNRVSRLLLAFIDKLRNSDRINAWLLQRSRHMFYEVDKDDTAARSDLLRAVINRLQSNGRFDPAICLRSDWTTARERAAGELGIAGIA